MAKVIQLPRGNRPPTEPRTVVIYVQSRGGGSVKSDPINHRHVYKILKMDAENLIEEFANLDSIQTVYVVGYHEAKDHLPFARR